MDPAPPETWWPTDDELRKQLQEWDMERKHTVAQVRRLARFVRQQIKDECGDDTVPVAHARVYMLAEAVETLADLVDPSGAS